MYEPKTVPYPHQSVEFRDHWKDRARGLLWDMGLGKSKEVIDQAGALIEAGEINAIVIVAPDGVHRNWITDEFPTHCPDRLLGKMRMHCYQTEKAQTKWHQAACEALLAHEGVIVVAMSYDAVCTEPTYSTDKDSGKRTMIWRGGKRFLWEILQNRKVLYIADEARRIKNPTADRTKVVTKSAKFAPYRRLLNGTPVPNGPFDIYSQMLFLDENFWKPHGISTFGAFKNMFGIFQPASVRGPGGVLRQFNQLVAYKNLPLLQRILGTMCSRLLKEDVLDLPPKVFSRRTFELTAAQWEVYRALESDLMATLETGELVTAPLAITRLLRFQQITSGYVPVDDPSGEPIHEIGKTNPRFDDLHECLEDIPGKAIVWCRFNRSVDHAMNVCELLKQKVVRYDGQVTPDQRAEAKELFQKGDAFRMIAKTSTAGEGLTLHAASYAVYCENTFDLAERQQSQDRIHRIGQKHTCNYYDQVALGTVDEKIVKALIEKVDISNQITGDRIREWIS
jgi:hypothetical protein